jgi:diguanylate cyclase (GGDEF)-like protein
MQQDRYAVKRVKRDRRQADHLVTDVVQRAAVRILIDDDHLFRAALDASVDGHSLWSPVVDHEGNVIDVQCFYSNPVSASFSGRTVGQLVGSRLLESARVAGNIELADTLMEVVRTGKPFRHRSSLKTREGSDVWCDFVVVRLAAGLSISGRDVTAEVLLNTQLGHANAELSRLAATDPLTDLMNRRAWTLALADHLVSARETRQSLVVALLDLDRFKVFNDTHGHLAGDDLLCEVSDRWRKALPLQATLARIGGEEFAVALPNTHPADARELLQLLCRVVPREQTSSAGLTLWDGVEGASSLVGRADAALYAAKHAGRNRVEALLPLP